MSLTSQSHTAAHRLTTDDGRVRLHGCQIFSREAANNERKVVQFRRPMFISKFFKSSPNVVVSMTGPTAATASRLPSSCQSTYSLLAFVRRKTLSVLREIFEVLGLLPLQRAEGVAIDPLTV